MIRILASSHGLARTTDDPSLPCGRAAAGSPTGAALLPRWCLACAVALVWLAPAGAAARPAAAAGLGAVAASAPAAQPAPAPVLPGTASGADAPLRLTLGDALQRARVASAHLAELRSLAAAAGAGLTGARAERLPQLDVSAGYTRQSDVPELSLTVPGLGTRTLFPNIPDNYRSRLGLALPLYTGGRIASSVTANAQQLAAANQDLQQGHADLALETATAYWGLVTARDSAAVLTASLADYEAHLKEARDRRDVGMAASNEVLAVAVQRDEAELARLQAASSAAVANANLVRLLDLPPGTRIEPVEPLAETPPVAAPSLAAPGAPAPPPPPAAPAGAPAAPPPPAAPTSGLATPPPPADSASTAAAAVPATILPPLTGAEPPETLVAAATAARPEIAALRSRITAGHASAEAARAAHRPQASLAAGYDYANPNPRILPLAPSWRSSWSVGATVSLSLFDGGRTAAAAAQIDAQADALGHRLEDLERRVRLEVTQRLLELGTARDAVAVANRNLDSARENVRVARDRYHAGVIPSSELLDAETALLRSGLDDTNALAQARLALANLERAVGR